MKVTKTRRATTVGAQGLDDPNGITAVVCSEIYKTDRQGLAVGVTVRVEYIETDGRPVELCQALAREIRRVEQGNQLSLMDDRTITKAMREMVAPIDGGGITSMTISTPGGKSATITAEDAERIRAEVDPETGEVQEPAPKGGRRRNGWGKAARV